MLPVHSPAARLGLRGSDSSLGRPERWYHKVCAGVASATLMRRSARALCTSWRPRRPVRCQARCRPPGGRRRATQPLPPRTPGCRRLRRRQRAQQHTCRVCFAGPAGRGGCVGRPAGCQGRQLAWSSPDRPGSRPKAPQPCPAARRVFSCGSVCGVLGALPVPGGAARPAARELWHGAVAERPGQRRKVRQVQQAAACGGTG